MAGAVLPWAGEFQVKIISACLLFEVSKLCRSGACQFRTTTTAFAVSKFCCSRHVDGNPSSRHCGVSVYWQPVWQMGWAINTHPQCPNSNEVKMRKA